MSKKRYKQFSKVIVSYVVLAIGLIVFASGWIYMIVTGGVKIIERPYMISIPRKYFGEILLSPPGEQRLSIETILEVNNFTAKGGVLEDVKQFSINNRSYILTTIKIKGRTLDGSAISLTIQIYNADSGELVGSGNIMNKSSIVDGEYIVSTSLGSGKYLLKLLSNSNTHIEYLALRGIYYDQLTNPALSISFTPEEFYHHTLYYVERVDLRDLWISVAAIVSGLTFIQISLVIAMFASKTYAIESPIVKTKKR
ncbi:MAG: hypothetical protein QXH73_05900 [Ignisphaera sp.]